MTTGVTTHSYSERGELKQVQATGGTPFTRQLTNNREGLITSRRENNGNIQNYIYFQGAEVASFGNASKPQLTESFAALWSSDYVASRPSSYAVNTGDTLAGIAQLIWGDSRMWYLIADANGLALGANDPLQGGDTLRIPAVAGSTKNNATTFKPYNPSDIIGDISPNPKAPPPPKKKCGVLAKIIQVVVTVVVTAILAPLGPVGYAIGSATGDFAGQVTSQIANGEFDWRAAAWGFALGGFAGAAMAGSARKYDYARTAIAAASSYVAASASGVVAGQTSQSLSWAQAARGAVAGNLVNQGANMALGRQESFSWGALAAAALAPPPLPGTGSNFIPYDVLARTANSVINQTIQMSIDGKGKYEWVDIAADAFGNALGNSIVAKMRSNKNIEIFQDNISKAEKDGAITPSEASVLRANSSSPQARSILERLLGDSAKDVSTFISIPESSDGRYEGIERYFDGKTGRLLEDTRSDFFEFIEKQRIDLTVSVAGITTGLEGGTANAIAIANASNTLVLGVNNPTVGVIFDLLQSAGQVVTNFEDPLSREVRRTVTEALSADRNGKLTVIGHSQGTIVTSNVLRSLHMDQRANIDYVSVATATPFVPSGLNSYKGFINPFDVVPLVTGGMTTQRVNHYSTIFDSYKNYSVTSTWFLEGNNHGFDLYIKNKDVIDALKGTKK
ncbi:MAG: hypothetical protein U0998_10140 [Moraxellaceae bacterium]|nr:hypothetical protein [Moraxellaceae bacterium]